MHVQPIDVGMTDEAPRIPETAVGVATRIFAPHVAGRLVFVFAVLLRFPAIIHGPATLEENRLAAGGAILAAEGAMYTDVADVVPPLGYAPYGALFSASWPFNLTGIAILAMLVTAATALLLGAAVRRVAGHDAGALAALAFVLFAPTTASFGALAATPPLFATFFITAALSAWLEFRARAKTLYAAIAGAAIGIAALYVGPAAFLLIVFVIDTPVFGAIAIGGALLPWAAATATIARPLVGSGILDAAFRIIFPIWGLLDAPGETLAATGLAFLAFALPLALIIVVATRQLRATPPISERRFVRLWLAGSLVPALLTDSPTAASFLPLLPPLVVLAAPALTDLLRSARRRLALAAALAPVLLLAAFQWARPSFESLLGPARTDLAAPAAAIRHATRATDPIFVWGPNAERLYVDAERRPASRWFQVFDGKKPKYIGDMVVGEITKSRPRVIVNLAPVVFDGAPELERNVSRFYRLAETGRDYRIYLRK